MKVYIAGPIRGYPDGNRAAFKRAAKKLLDIGHEPVNPHDLPVLEHDGPCLGAEVDHSEHRYGCFMVPDIHALLDCEGFTLLPGWHRSSGAIVEEQVARICGKMLIVLWEGAAGDADAEHVCDSP